MPYKWFATRIGTMSQRKNFCASCQIRPSDKTTSGNLQQLYGAIENAEDALNGDNLALADIGSILNECAEQVREVSEQYGESADNMEEGFGHETSSSQEIREKADELESFADELESAGDDIDGMDDPDDEASDIMADFEGDTDEDGKPVDDDEAEEFVQSVRDERRENAITAANDALCNCPL